MQELEYQYRQPSTTCRCGERGYQRGDHAERKLLCRSSIRHRREGSSDAKEKDSLY